MGPAPDNRSPLQVTRAWRCSAMAAFLPVVWQWLVGRHRPTGSRRNPSRRRPTGPRLEPADEAIPEQDREDVVAPAPLGGRDVDLPDVVEVEELPQEIAVPAQRVERSEERHTASHAAGRLAGSDFAARLLGGRGAGAA